MNAQQLISDLNLKPHPEGGHYKELFRSSSKVEPEDGRGARSAITTIYFLLAEHETSALHLVSSDEVWHYVDGAPLELITCDPAFAEEKRHMIGPIRNGMNTEYVVRANDWQAARSTGKWTLVSCVVGPGFDFNDFKMLRDRPDEMASCKKRLPGLAAFI